MISTTLLIGLTPIDKSLFFNQSAESSTLTFEIESPEYLGQSSDEITFTSIFNFSLSIEKFFTDGKHIFKSLFLVFRAAFKSLATPM